MIFDAQGRIVELDEDEMTSRLKEASCGHSACAICGKDMLKCWDVVCYVCRKTVCYDHANAYGDKWICHRCN